MEKKYLLLLLMAIMPLSMMKAFSPSVFQQVYLSVRYFDPTIGQQEHPRSPIQVPEVGIDGDTLYFFTSCDGCTLRIVNEDGEVEYATVIPTDCESIELPATLEGEFEIQIIRDNYCFYGDIFLE